jgi:MSHA pilin protein MshA
MRRQNHGFTLIELVIVITILAILGAVALPKFISMQADARVAKMNGALAAIKASAAMAHAQLIARGFDAGHSIDAASSNIVVEGTPVGFVNGYPDASQIAEISGLSSQDFYLPAAGSSEQVIASDSNHTGAGGQPPCTLVYQEAVSGRQPTYIVNATLESCQ